MAEEDQHPNCKSLQPLLQRDYVPPSAAAEPGSCRPDRFGPRSVQRALSTPSVVHGLRYRCGEST